MLEFTLSRVLRFATWYTFLDQSSEPPIFVVGSGRSGTTWLAETINHENKLRIVFEPFHGNKGLTLRRAASWQYIDPDEPNPVCKEDLHQVLYGKYRNRWVDSWNRKRFRVYRGRCIKSIRAHTFLGFLKREFPEVKIVFMMRHPISVVASWAKLDWPLQTQTFLTQQSLLNGPLAGYQEFIQLLSTNLEFRALRWCIENYLALRQLSDSDAHVVFYEDMCLSFSREIGRLVNYLGIRHPINLKSLEVSPALSHIGDMCKPLHDRMSQTKWSIDFDDDQIKQIWHVIQRFGLDRVYSRAHASPLLDNPQHALELF